MPQTQKILAGFQSDFGRNVVQTLKEDGHQIGYANSFQGIFAAIRLFNQDDTRSPIFSHTYIVMDVHLGSDTKTFRPGEIVYRRICQDVVEGRIGFMSFASDRNALLDAREKQIPVIGITEMNRQLEFYALLRGEVDVAE